MPLFPLLNNIKMYFLSPFISEYNMFAEGRGLFIYVCIGLFMRNNVTLGIHTQI